MSDIIVTSPQELGLEYVPGTTHDIDGDFWRGNIAGYLVDECSVYCHECATDIDRDRIAKAPNTEQLDPIMASSEWDHPGHICESCHRTLDTHLLVYPNGPGSRIHRGLKAIRNRPVLESKETGIQTNDYHLSDNGMVVFGLSDIPDMGLQEFSDFIENNCKVL
jgi:hypothetical protein